MSVRSASLVLLLGLAPLAPAAEPADPLWLEPVDARPVDDRTLDAARGKFLGANMLVGVRIDLVTQLTNAAGGQAGGQASLYIVNTPDGPQVQVDTRSSAGGAAGVAGNGVATGGDALIVNGVGQVTQIAGDGNRMGNTAVIRVVDALPTPTGFNGERSSQSQAGPVTATVSFAEGGLQMGVQMPGARLGQTVRGGAGDGGVLQQATITGDGFTGSNTLQMQILAAPLPLASLSELGVQQARAAAGGLGP